MKRALLYFIVVKRLQKQLDDKKQFKHKLTVKESDPLVLENDDSYSEDSCEPEPYDDSDSMCDTEVTTETDDENDDESTPVQG